MRLEYSPYTRNNWSVPKTNCINREQTIKHVMNGPEGKS